MKAFSFTLAVAFLLLLVLACRSDLLLSYLHLHTMDVETETQSKKRSYDSTFNSQTQTPSISNSQAKPKKQRGCDNPKPMPKDGCETTADRMFLNRLVNYLKTQTKYNDITDAKFIVERRLTHSDVDKVDSRLAFTRKQIRTPFLTNSLELALQWKDENKQNVKIDVNAIIVGLNLKEYKLALSRWNYHDKGNNNCGASNQKKKKKTEGHNNNNNINSNNDSNNNNNNNVNNKKKTGWKYVLKNQWNDLRRENNLQVGDVVRLVSFSSHNKLHIAILKV